jgi:hypothetical protein
VQKRAIKAIGSCVSHAQDDVYKWLIETVAGKLAGHPDGPLGWCHAVDFIYFKSSSNVYVTVTMLI